jgi:hypothetical protein
MAKAKMGAKVMYCGHDGWFVADIYLVGGANIVRANGAIDGGKLVRGRNHEATHYISDFPSAGFWNPALGVFAVVEGQVTELAPGWEKK